MGRMTGERWRSQARESCETVAPWCFGRGVELAAWARELAGGDGKPGDEGELVFGAVVDDVLMLAVAEVVLVLNADDVDDLAGLVDLVGFDFAESDVADLALLLELLDGAERLFHGNLGVDAVELPEVDALEFEAAQAHLDLLDEVLRAADGEPFVWALAGEAGFGGDDDTFGIGGEGFADELLADLGAVGVCGVDEVDAELDCAAQDLFCRFAILGSPQIPSPVMRMAP